jgi:hypothetical protein
LLFGKLVSALVECILSAWRQCVLILINKRMSRNLVGAIISNAAEIFFRNKESSGALVAVVSTRRAAMWLRRPPARFGAQEQGSRP